MSVLSGNWKTAGEEAEDTSTAADTAPTAARPACCNDNRSRGTVRYTSVRTQRLFIDDNNSNNNDDDDNNNNDDDDNNNIMMMMIIIIIMMMMMIIIIIII